MTFNIRRHGFYFSLLLIALCSCGAPKQEAPAPVPTLQPIPAGAPVTAPPVMQMQPQIPSPQVRTFDRWLSDFKREALSKGISQPVLENAFAGVTPSETVLERDQTQPEHTKSFEEYKTGFLKQKKIDAALDQWESHRDILKQVQETYGVPAPILLSLWQTESNFGKIQGNFSIIQSLATLAYDGRRSEFFRKELMNALIILQQEHMDAANLTGSWAGAMGQTQFMPSSFLSFAVDFDGDGRKDIWHSDADALASMANYLNSRGWDGSIGWGIHVRVPESGDVQEWVDSKQKHTFRQWQRLGIRKANGGKLPAAAYELRLVMPDGDSDNAYLVTSNYDVIMDWNHSTYFATCIGLLADAIARQ